MITKLLQIGLDQSLGFEETIKVKLLNAVSLLFFLILYFFIIYHTFFTKTYPVAIAQFSASLSIPLIFYLQHKHKYSFAKIVYFIFLHLIIFFPSMFLLLGRGVENFYIVVIILTLILIKESFWSYLLIFFDVFLYISPQLFFHPYPTNHYSFVTSLVVLAAILLSVRFFIIIKNEYEERLKTQKEKLEKLNDEKSDLMGIVAHDLKNPLAQIKGLVSILELDNEKLNDEQHQLILKIKRVINNQHNHITRVLDAQSLEATFEELALEKISIKKIVEMSLDDMLAQSTAKDIKLNYTYSANTPYIKGNELWLSKVVTNLISNAIKFSHSGTIIQTQIKSLGNDLIISIKDEGQGFSNKDLELIFKKNKMLSAVPTANESSSGMGLYIVKKYVDRMKGSIWVESQEDIGAIFYIKFPTYSKSINVWQD